MERRVKVGALFHHPVSLEFSLIWFSAGREQHLHDAERKHKSWVKLKEKRRAEKWIWEKEKHKKRGRERDRIQEEQSIKDIKRQVYTLWEWGGGRVSQLRLLTTWCEGSSECANIQPLNDWSIKLVASIECLCSLTLSGNKERRCCWFSGCEWRNPYLQRFS